jgi:hypothetical protein
MGAGGLRAKIEHCPLPQRTVVGGNSSVPIYGQQVGIFVNQRIADLFLSIQESSAETNKPVPKVGLSGGDTI